MGCGGSKDATRSRSKAAHTATKPTPGYPLLDTPEEQSKYFLELCGPPSRRPQQQGSNRPLYPNPLAVELRRVYTETRQRVFDQQTEDEEATARRREKERAARLQRVHNRLPSLDIAGPAAAADSSLRLQPTSSSSVLPPALQQPAQNEFTLFVNDSVAQAYQRGFTAFNLIEAVELFVGYVKHDLRQQQENAYRENANGQGSRHGSLGQKNTANPNAVTTSSSTVARGNAANRGTVLTPSTPWTCRMQCTLSGDSPVSEALLEAGRQRWRQEREASHVKAASPASHSATRPSNNNNKEKSDKAAKKEKAKKQKKTSGSKGGKQAAAAEVNAGEPAHDDEAGLHSVQGGKGLLFIDAVFESAVPGSFDRRTPWQLEIGLYFTE